jgi:hypothetical protein
MRSNVYTLAAIGTKVIPLDERRNPPNVSVQVILNAGATATFSVDHTYDDVQDPTITPTWWTAAALAAKVASLEAQITTLPCRALRLNLTAVTGLGVTITVFQAGDR